MSDTDKDTIEDIEPMKELELDEDFDELTEPGALVYWNTDTTTKRVKANGGSLLASDYIKPKGA